MDYRKLYTWRVIADKSMQPNMAELSRAADAGVMTQLSGARHYVNRQL